VHANRGYNKSIMLKTATITKIFCINQRLILTDHANTHVHAKVEKEGESEGKEVPGGNHQSQIQQRIQRCC
jgi:hypothetical protein